MDYPTAVLEKAKRLEQLLQRVAAGEPLAEVNEALGLNLGEKQLVRAQAKYEAGGCRWEALIDGRYGHAQKVHSGIREWLYTRKERDEEVRAPQLAQEIKEKFGVEVDPGHVNYLLRKRGLTAPPGHPYPKEAAGEEGREATAAGASIDNAGLFSLEGAKVAMEVVEPIEETVLGARDAYLESYASQRLHHLSTDIAALWPKIDHLLYQPILGVERPRCLYYYQGDGLEAVYGFTYKYLTLEHFLGQLSRVQVGVPLAEALTAVYVQTWYPGDDALTIFVDWHTKPHWTKSYSHAGHLAMWGRTMPGTKQLILNGFGGRYLGGWDYPIDAHMTHTLVDVEIALEGSLGRPIACTVMDSEGGGLPLAERYAEAARNYVSVLPGEHTYCLADFVLVGCWEPVPDDAQREATFAHWADPKRADGDPRQLVLMRRVGQTDPTRIYTGQFAGLSAGEIPWLHRRRWPYNELRIRDLIHGANLNVNYGYAYAEVPHRTRQREWEAAQERVAVTERHLVDHQAAVHHLRQRLAALQDAYAAQQRDLHGQLVRQRQPVPHRQRLGQTTTRVLKRIKSLRRQLNVLTRRFQKRQRRLFQQLHDHQTRAHQLKQRLLHRLAFRDAIDTETLCRERDLHKDQIIRRTISLC